MKNLLIYLCFVICIHHSIAQDSTVTYTDTLSIYYELDKSDLKANQKKDIVKHILLERDSCSSLYLNAYCDYLASDAYNKKLAGQRAEGVRLLINKNKPSLNQFTKVNPIGRQVEKHPSEAVGNSKNRRVDILLTHHKTFAKEKKPIKPTNETSEQIKKLSVGDQFVVKGMNFTGGRHFLTKASEPKLEKLYKALIENPEIHIEIQGHICCQNKGDGTDHDTGKQNLSVARAEYVYNKLIEKGINQERLSFKGFGSSKKLFPEERNGHQQQQNRRVEILITKK